MDKDHSKLRSHVAVSGIVALKTPPMQMQLYCPTSGQGILTEGEGSVHLTSSLRYLVLSKVNHIFKIKATGLNQLVQGGQLY